MADLLYASQLAYHIGLPMVAVATIVRYMVPARFVSAARFVMAFGSVFLGWALAFWLARFLPWTYLGL